MTVTANLSFSLLLAVTFSTIVLANASNNASARNPSLLWGPYRPNLYFGMRPRIPESVLIGLMWTRVENGRIVLDDLRHTCEQDEGITGYGWTDYDPRSGGSQTIHDVGNNLDVSTDLFKDQNSEDGSSWGVRVSGKLRNDISSDSEHVLVFYMGIEEKVSDETVNLQCVKLTEEEQIGIVECIGHQSTMGDFNLRVVDAGSSPLDNKARSRTTIHSDTVPGEGVWQANAIYIAHVNSGKQQSGNGSLYFIEIRFKAPATFDVLFSASHTSRSLTTDELTTGFTRSKSSFEKLFDAVYAPQKPFSTFACTQFSRSLLSNLLGGIGYFYGDAIVDRSGAREDQETDLKFTEKAQQTALDTLLPEELFSFVPSRSSFPHGFLWDEGFHLLIVLDWDLDLALEILQSWFWLMNQDGWIARGQMLGAEARSKVPFEFQAQHPHHANPPTMFLVVSAFVDILGGKRSYWGQRSRYLADRSSGIDFITQLYPLLKQHYDWFRRTQSAKLEEYERPEHEPNEAYRWRGRAVQHTLPSGLDDYPRAQPPHSGELHIDGLSWIASMAGVLQRVAAFLAEDANRIAFAAHEEAIRSNIESLHWSEEEQTYCDVTIVEEKHSLVCHKGYLSLFPFLVGLIDAEHKHLGAVLDLIQDETELWSPYGIRSLSKNDALYGTEENHWRGPIWININFMILERLLELAQTTGSHKEKACEMYSSLRRNLVNTVYKSWSDTGFAWEQYNPETGAGQRAQHFTGWTALVVKIAAMPDLEVTSMSSGPGSKSLLNGYTAIAGVVLLLFVVTFRKRLLKILQAVGK